MEQLGDANVVDRLMFRLFVGIAFPEHVRLRLAGLCSGLLGAKWIPPENMHLTVRFIGEVGGAQAEDIDMALGHISAPAFELIISGIDCFESGGKVHTLWAGIDKQPLLLHLYGKVEFGIGSRGLRAREAEVQAACDASAISRRRRQSYRILHSGLQPLGDWPVPRRSLHTVQESPQQRESAL